MGAYDRDFHAWALEQAELLRSRSANALDWENLAEEIESLGRRERAELRSRLTVLMTHLLKWMLQPRMRSRDTIRTQRREIAELLEENPSLHPSLADVAARAYAYGREDAARETGIAETTFPVTPAFTVEQALDRDWLPDGEERL